MATQPETQSTDAPAGARTDIRSQLRTLTIAKEQRPELNSGGTGNPVAGRDFPWKKLATFIVVAAVLVASVFGWQYLSSGNAGEAVAAGPRLLTVTHRAAADPMTVLTATGKIVSDHKVLVNTKVSGQIVDLRFEQGDDVQKGQTLALIEDVLYRARRDEAAAQLEQAQASLAYHQINFDRVNKLFEQDSAPEIEYAQARRDLDEARARVAAAQAMLEFTQKALTDCAVLAPISGVILERNVEIGDFVAAEGGRGAIANAQLCTIADMTKLRVEVDVSELDIARLRPDMHCKVTPDAYKDRGYGGRVMWLDPGANYSKATVQVKVRIENPDDRLRVEGSAQVTFLADPPSNEDLEGAAAIWIPATACRRDAQSPSQAKVFLAVDGRLKATSVRIGRQVGNQVEVLEGLSSGQSIVADDLDRFRDGQRLRS